MRAGQRPRAARRPAAGDVRHPRRDRHASSARGGTVELGPGDFFGELDAARARRHARSRASARVRDMRCLASRAPTPSTLVESEPTVALAMLQELARRLRRRLVDSAASRASLAPTLTGVARRRNEADRREPPRAARLRAPRARRGRGCPDGHRGEVRCATARCSSVRRTRTSASGEAWLIGASIAEYAQGGALRPRSRIATASSSCTARDRLALREGAREGPDARSHAACTSRTVA